MKSKNKIIIGIITIIVILIISCGTIFMFNRSNNSNSSEDKDQVTNVDNKVTDIVIPYEKIVLKLNSTYTLKVSVLPTTNNNDVSYVIKDDKIASIDENGKIMALGVGKTTLTISSGDITKTCTIEIVEEGNSPKSMMIEEPTSKINIGDVEILKVNLDNEKAITPDISWSSSNEKIVTVDEKGMINVKAKGEVYITATTKDGVSCSIKLEIDDNSSNEEVKDDQKEEAKQEEIKEDLEDKKEETTDKKEEDSSIAQCSYKDEILTYVGKSSEPLSNCKNVTYKSSNENVVSVTKDGVITPKKIGTAIITATLNGEKKEINVYVDHEKIVKGNNTLVLYNVVDAESLSTDYKVYVKLPEETTYHEIQVFKAQVSYTDLKENWHSTYTSYANFDFKGTVNVKVVPKSNFSNYRLRGNIYSQNSKKNNNEILFNLTNYGVISLETKTSTTDYNTGTNLQIFANALDTNFEKINLNDENTIYIGPGEHKCVNGICNYAIDKEILKEKRKNSTSSESYPAAINLNSNSKLYISGSAVVHSQVTLDKWNDSTRKGTKITNVNILGRGTLDTSDLISSSINSNKITFTDSNVTAGLIRIIYSDNVKIDGIILKNSTAYNLYLKDSNNIEISNLKVISAGKYTDGIHILSSRNINANNVFIRTGDDSIAVYASRGSGGFKSGSFVGLNGDTLNLKFNNLLLWNDNGRSIFIGGHGNYDSTFGVGNKISEVEFTKVKVLESNKRIDHEGALTVASADNNYVSNITFNDVEVDHLMEGNFITIKNYCSNYSKETYVNTKANKCGYMINNVTFNNVKWSGKYDNKQNVNSWIDIQGTKTSSSNTCSKNNEDHVVSLIKFNNVTIGDTKLSNSNKSSKYSDTTIYKSNSCVYNQAIN